MTDDLTEMLNGLSIEEAARLMQEGRLSLWDTPAKTLGERVARALFVGRMNEELARRGSPVRIRPAMVKA